MLAGPCTASAVPMPSTGTSETMRASVSGDGLFEETLSMQADNKGKIIKERGRGARSMSAWISQLDLHGDEWETEDGNGKVGKKRRNQCGFGF